MVERAEIFEKTNRGSSIRFQFNPETISFTKAANWQETETQSSETAPVRQFGGAGAIELSLKLFLDDTVEGGSSVTERVNRMARWTNPKEENRESKPEPAILVFNWGKFSIGTTKQFECHLKSVSVEYTMFSYEGVPLRAQCTVQLIGTGAVSWGQNPTSGGRYPARSATLQAGETLPLLAHRHYGRAQDWKEIAAFNGIDNPFNVSPSRNLVLPDLASEPPNA